MVAEYDFLTEHGYSVKDRLVMLASAVWEVDDPTVLADRLALSVSSVRASLAKRGLDERREKTLRDEVTEALIDVCTMDTPSMRQRDWSHLTKVATNLIEAGATGPEVKVRARNLQRRIHVAVTPGSLDKYWAQLGERSPYSPGRMFR